MTDEPRLPGEAAKNTDEPRLPGEVEPRAVPASAGTPESNGRSAHSFGQDVKNKAAQIVARYPQPRSALLPLLHLVQSEEGHVSQAGIAFCAELLDLGVAEVSAVATFYTMYKRRPCGEHLVSVCTNALCATLGG